MKPPKAWSPEEALQAHQYLIQNPDAADVSAALKAYDEHEAVRAANHRDNAFTPERRPGGMMGLRTLLPESLYGIATTHQDPSLGDFRKTAKLTPGDDEATAYQDFKDEAWAKAYDDAAQKGLPISRKAAEAPSKPSFAAERSNKSFDEQFDEGKAAGEVDASQKFTKGLAGAGQSYLDGMAFPGASSLSRGVAGAVSPAAGKYLDEASDSIGPLGRGAAELAGTMNPVSLAGKAASAIMGKPEGIIAGLGKGIASGAALGAGGLATNQSSKLAEDILRSQYKPGEAGDRLADTVTGLPASMLFGGLMGAVPGAAQGFANDLVSPLTSAGRALRAFKETGGKTSVTAPNGLELPPTLEELVRGGGPFEHPTDNAVNLAKPLIAQGAASRIDETVSPIEAEKEAYHAASDKLGGKAQFTPMTKALVEVIRARSFDSTEGGALPMTENAPFVKELHKTAEPSIAVNHEAQARERHVGAIRVPLDEAIASGMIPADKPIRFSGKMLEEGRPTMPPGPADSAAQNWEGQAGSSEGLPPLVVRGNEMGANTRLYGELSRGDIKPPSSPRTVVPKDMDPTSYSVLFTPREGTSRQVDQVIDAVDRAAGISEAEGAGRVDPAYKVLPGAARAMRDQLPPVPGITDKYPDVSITGPDGNPLALTGRSAMAHAHSQQLAGMQRSMKQAGMPSDRFDPTDVLQQDKAGQALFGIGPGVGETNRTAAVMDLAKRTKGGERAIKDVIASRIVNGGELAPKGVGVPSANPERAAAQLAHKYQYKLDPIAQFLGKGAPLSGASSVISDPVTRALLDLAQRTQQGSP